MYVAFTLLATLQMRKFVMVGIVLAGQCYAFEHVHLCARTSAIASYPTNAGRVAYDAIVVLRKYAVAVVPRGASWSKHCLKQALWSNCILDACRRTQLITVWQLRLHSNFCRERIEVAFT